MIKKFLFIIFLIVTVSISAGISLISFNPINVNAAENLILNGGFEDLSSGLPKDWYTNVYNTADNQTRFYIDSSSPHSGTNCMAIESLKAEDAKIIQKISVKPGTVYRLNCWVKADGVGGEGKGVNISVLGITDTSLDVIGTSTDWTEVELYGKTGKDQNYMEVTARLGGYGSLNFGKAYFDDFSAEEAATAPENVKVVNFYQTTNSDTSSTAEIRVKIPMAGSLLILSLFWLMSFIFYNKIIKKDKDYPDSDIIRERILLTLLLMFALILRLIIAPVSKGFEGDVNTFKAWAQMAASKGLANFYSPDVFADYPPGYIYVLYLIGKIQMLFSIGVDSKAMLLLIKLPAIAADIICTFLIYKIARKKTGFKVALALSAVYALNPAVIVNSASWGQVDGFFTLFILLMVYYTFEEKLLAASLVFTLAVLVKPQALIFAPLLIFAFIQKKNLKLLLYSGGCSILLFIIMILPFSPKQNIFWIVDKYIATLSSYPYASVNAFNLFAFTGGNWVSETKTLLLFDYKTWGFLFILFTVLFSAYVFFRSKHPAKLLYISVYIIVSVFVLSSKMHERYMFPAIILTLLWYIHVKEKRILYLFVIVTSTIFLNETYVLQAVLKQVTNIKTSGITSIVSLANIGLLIYLIVIGTEYSKNIEYNEVSEAEKYLLEEKRIEEALRKEKVVFEKKDFILMAVLVVLYSAIAFVNLGSTKVPQTFWQPADAGDCFYVDLGANKEINKVAWYFGLGQGSYDFSFSNDAVNWSDNVTLNQESIYVWKNMVLNKNARYVKITVNTFGGMMNEIGFFGNNTDKPYEIKKIVEIKVTPSGKGNPGNVFDEQSMATLKPSYKTGMIFDEIYHARTAYESLHRLEPYEWTHPPLGKLLIAVGVFLFGMDPFGWRIVGTVFGIIMIPFMYLLGKRLFKKTEYAFLTAFLMTFDFMHFTQTRIATVDVYAVFFIILMYYYMYKYTETDVYEKGGFPKSMIQLGLCGLFFGLGAASKWICLYSGAGLAILFFKNLYDKYQQYKFSRKYYKDPEVDRDTEKYARCKKIAWSFEGNTFKTVIYCFFVFIILPAAIYIASYIPFMLVPGPGHGLINVLKLQGYMYNYHSNLVATHPFSSPWYQWPFIIKPIWYYSGEGLAPGKMSSIVSMGNPAIWWAGALAAVAVFITGIRKKDKAAFFIIVGGLSQYLPWILVPRLTFIYHYFATVPFIMLCIVYIAAYKTEKNPSWKKVTKAYMVIVALLFIIFYPVISGAVIDTTFAGNFLKWFNSWIF